MNLLHATNKVGLLPYRFSTSFPESSHGEDDRGIRPDHPIMRSAHSGDDKEKAMHFLLHLPRPKNPAEAHLMKWGIARGTVRRRDASGAWADIREAALLPSIPLADIEPHEDAALHEAEEELGLRMADIDMQSWRDHGLLTYDSETRGSYSLHLFSVAVRDGVEVDALKVHAKDALDIGWFTLPQMHEMIAAGQMKAGYAVMVEAVLGTVVKFY